jgi:hypothetical protein
MNCEGAQKVEGVQIVLPRDHIGQYFAFGRDNCGTGIVSGCFDC